jgi:hypothetical protein
MADVSKGEHTTRGTRFAQTACQEQMTLWLRVKRLTLPPCPFNEKGRDCTFEKSSLCCKEECSAATDALCVIARQDRKPLRGWATKANPAKAGDAKLRG